MEMVLRPQPSGSSTEFKMGDRVLYVNRKDRTLVPSEIIHVDLTTDPPQYGIRKGGSLQEAILYTEKERLRATTGTEVTPLVQYSMSPAYRSVQFSFEQAQSSHDPQAIAEILRRAPYHIDSLLQMFELYRSMGENNYAEDCLARALYSLEMGFHPSFDLTSPYSLRLDYGIEENRALFNCLFRHVQHLSRQGCHRAAFECCKLLLSLEPRDPLGSLFLIDYLALRADRDQWLITFTLGFKEGQASIPTLPNFAFSSSLARFRVAVKAHGSIGGALGQMVQAIQLHPYVFPKIIAYLVDKGTCRESHWLSILSRQIFTQGRVEDESNPSLTHLVTIYIERSGLLWKPSDALELLRCAAMIATSLHDGVSPEAAASSASSPVLDSDQFEMPHRHEAAKIAAGLSGDDWSLVRREAFPPPSKPADQSADSRSIGGLMRDFLGIRGAASSSNVEVNHYGNLRVEDFTDNVARLPAEEMNAVFQPRAAGGRRGGGDDDAEAMQEIAEQMAMMNEMDRQREQLGLGGGQLQGMAELQGMNPIMAMLQTLMPWVNVGQQPNYDEDEGDSAGLGEGERDQF